MSNEEQEIKYIFLDSNTKNVDVIQKTNYRNNFPLLQK